MAQEPDIDLGAVTEALNNKVDTDVGNVNHDGSTQIANYAMPSTTFENVTLAASGTAYTAPADGWYHLNKTSSAAGQYASFVAKDANDTVVYSIYTTAMGSPTAETLLAPVSKGMKLQVNYNLGGSTKYFRFIYAKGSEPQS